MSIRRKLYVFRQFELVGHLLILLLLIRKSSPIPIDNGLIGAEIVHECFAGRRVDLAFILDGSGSIGDDTFDLQKAFVNTLVDRLDVADNATLVGVVQYADFPTLEISFMDHIDKTQLQWAVQRIRYLSGTTNTGSALQFTLDNLFPKARGGDVPKVAVVITDGQSQDAVAMAAEHLKGANVLVYAVGVTNLINVNELYLIAGSPSRVFTVETFDQLNAPLSDMIALQMCKTEFRPGTPEVICGSDRIGVRAATKNPFEGYVFVKGHFHTEGCRVGAEAFSDPKTIGLTIPFRECDTKRWRSLNPRGIYVETTVVFMFHTTFMTKVDQAVKVICFYMEADKTVSVPLEVSMLPTEFRDQTYPMPTCTYTLRRGSPDGPIIRYANIGEPVYHRWECIESEESYDIFGMLVHSCYVDDAHGDRVDVIDENGCGLDVHILNTPEYDSSLRLAVREAHVFKYADRPVLQFQCQITVCIKYDGDCDQITPPDCPVLTAANSRLTGGNHLLNSNRPQHSNEILRGKRRRRRELLSRYITFDNTMDVLTESLTVFDPEPTAPGDMTNYKFHDLATSQADVRSTDSTTHLLNQCITYWTLILSLIFTSIGTTAIVTVFYFVCCYNVNKRRR